MSDPVADEAATDGESQNVPDQILRATSRFRMALLAGRFRGRIGTRRGTGPGSSLELHDFRDYAPGDDLRHVDWGGYARTDQLRVRLHEAEVAPLLELLVDTSPSMAVRPAKQATLRALVGAFAHWARADGSTLRTMALGGGLLATEPLTLDGASEPASPQVAMRSGSVRVLLTDGLWAQDPAPMLRRLAAHSARFFCLQLLDPWEREPRLDEAVMLRDCETGERAVMRLDASMLRVYHERLERLCASLRRTVHSLGGDHVPLTAGDLAQLCQRDLLPAGVVEPA